MRRFYGLSIFLALAFLLASCAETMEQNTLSRKADYQENRELLTKSLADRLSQGVTRTDVEDYLVYRMNISLDAVKDITRYDIDEDAYIFIVNLNEGGWYIFSGDYSSVPVIAEGDDEPLHLSGNLTRHGKAWLQTVRDNIIKNRSIQSEKVLKNRAAWLRAKYLSAMHRVGNHNLRSDTYDSFLVLDTLIDGYCAPLTQTIWDQGLPWNNNMPKLRFGTNRCLAGCTVIAIAQLLYYTHYAFGFPNDLYENSSCDDYYDQGPAYNFVFSNPSTTSWNHMTYNSGNETDPYMPAFCALIAKKSNTAYGVTTPNANSMDDSYGSTCLDSIPGTLQSFFLSGVSDHIFSQDSVINELTNSRPVLCSGGESLTSTIGHTFLIDGYRWFRVKETEYVVDENNVIIDEIVNIYNYFYWHINTGDLSPAHQFWADEDDHYYPVQRHMFIGWHQ